MDSIDEVVDAVEVKGGDAVGFDEVGAVDRPVIRIGRRVACDGSGAFVEGVMEDEGVVGEGMEGHEGEDCDGDSRARDDHFGFM